MTKTICKNIKIGIFTILSAGTLGTASAQSNANDAKPSNKVFVDVHHFGPGRVSLKDVAGAHQKDLAVQKEFNVDFFQYWVDETKGDVYCFSNAPEAKAITLAHTKAHGLVPAEVNAVTAGKAEKANKQKHFFLDVHEFGAGKVKAQDVAEAHKKDIEIQKKYKVNIINYWVDEKGGKVMCLIQAPDTNAIYKTHKEAHGLLPARVMSVTH
jgi:hypothetical protein